MTFCYIPKFIDIGSQMLLLLVGLDNFYKLYSLLLNLYDSSNISDIIFKKIIQFMIKSYLWLFLGSISLIGKLLQVSYLQVVAKQFLLHSRVDLFGELHSHAECTIGLSIQSGTKFSTPFF
jgi:hypothetical protein